MASFFVFVLFAFLLFFAHSAFAISRQKSTPLCGVHTIGFHPLSCDADGNIVAWLSPDEAINRTCSWYFRSPLNVYHFPPVSYSTFVDGNYNETLEGIQIIGGMQDGMGIISYLKAYRRSNFSQPLMLRFARYLGDYLVQYANTPNEGEWPSFTRSSGVNLQWPEEMASQADILYGVNTIEPDKGGIAGYALVLLYNATGNETYLAQALQNAVVLAKHQQAGNSTHAPWPFRVDSVTGVSLNGNKSGDMVYVLRLYRALVELGYGDMFESPAASLWAWINDVQLATLPQCQTNASACHFVNFFEDIVDQGQNNRNSWTALELARYLIEQRQSGLDPLWHSHVRQLLDYSLALFSAQHPGNVTVMGEQDQDRKSWGGANSKLGSVALMYSCAGGDSMFHRMGLNNLAWMSYFVDVDGCPSAQAFVIDGSLSRGGWQEDAHTDVLHNFVDGANALDGIC